MGQTLVYSVCGRGRLVVVTDDVGEVLYEKNSNPIRISCISQENDIQNKGYWGQVAVDHLERCMKVSTKRRRGEEESSCDMG